MNKKKTASAQEKPPFDMFLITSWTDNNGRVSAYKAFLSIVEQYVTVGHSSRELVPGIQQQRIFLYFVSFIILENDLIVKQVV